MKEVDIGNESFADMINNDSYYVDKTSFIKSVFQEEASRVLFLTRPRRFGKTLTMNTFYEFLRLNPKDPNNSEDTSYQGSLFKNTKIYEDKEFCQEYMGKFPVIFITLKDVVGDTPIETTRENLQNSLLFLSECLSIHHGVKPIILIDEYDVPISKAAHYGYYNKMIPFISVFLVRP